MIVSVLGCFTFEQRATFPHSDGPGRSVLAQTQLHEEERDSTKKQHDEVGDEKHTCEERKRHIVRCSWRGISSATRYLD